MSNINKYDTRDKYNIKDKKVNIYNRVVEAPDYQEQYKKALSQIWAYTRQLSESLIVSQRIALAQEHILEERIFILNQHEEIKEGNLIEYKGNFYQITRVTTRDDYNTDMIAYVSRYEISENEIIEEETGEE